MRLRATRLTSIAQAGGQRTLIQRAISILRRYGQDAHIYLPGVGMLNGLQAGNYLDSALTTPATIDNPVGGVVDAIGGINATQATTASKPILRRGAVNLLTYSGDFSNAAWLKNGVLSTTPGQLDPYGGTGATLFIESTVNGIHRQYQQPVVYSAVSAHTIAVVIKDGGVRYGTIATYEGVTGGKVYSGNYDLQTGVVTGTGVTGNTPIPTGSIVPVGNGFYLAVLNITTTGAGSSAALEVLTNRVNASMLGGVEPSYTGDGVSGLIIHRAALFQGTYTAAQIQALGGIPLTTTAPASTALGQQYWQFDGSNDSLSLGGPIGGTSEFAFVIAFRLNSLTTQVLFDEGTNGFRAYVTATGGVDFNKNGVSAFAIAPSGTVVAGEWVVISCRQSGGVGVIRKNGVQIISSANVISASGLSATVLGASNPAASFFVNGSIGLGLPIKGTVTDPDLLLLEKFVANLSGVQI